jgi:negative regulator of flagellin synthesis FlgM
MKISGRKSQSIGPMGPLTGLAQSEEAAEAAQTQEAVTDQVNLASSTEVRKLAQTAEALPTMRMEKVEGLRGQIDDGSYYVESEKLARKVVDEALQDILAEERRKSSL